MHVQKIYIYIINGPIVVAFEVGMNDLQRI